MARVPADLHASPFADAPLGTTAVLIRRARDGDDAAREELLRRCIEVLRRFAHGRLPRGARGMLETQDLVQMALVRALEHFDTFTPRRKGSLLAYLRQIVLNQVRDEARRLAVRSPHEQANEALADPARSPLEEVIGQEVIEAYENALLELSPTQQEAVLLRLEMGSSYEEIARWVGSTSPDAARMLVARAVKQLAEKMRALRE